MGAKTGGGYRVLLVGDDREVLDSVKGFLKEHDGFKVTVAASVGEAVDLVDGDDLDCVVCGEGTDEIHSVDILRRVRASSDVPFVAFLGDVSSEEEMKAIEAGATDVVRTTLRGFIAGVEDPGREQHDVLANRVRNIVERERARTNYREIFDKANDAIFVHDPETGEILDVNERMCEMYGYTREEALGLNVEEISAEGYTQEDAVEKIRLAEEEGSQIFEWRNVTKDGDEFWVEVSLRRATIDGDDRILAIVRDITERKENQRRLKESEERFRAIVDQSLAGVYVVKDGVFDYVNPAFAEILGEEVDDVVGRPPTEYVPHKEDREMMRENLRKREEGEVDTIRYSFTAETADGDERRLMVHGTRIELPDGPAVAGILVEEDIG
ncbi:MAG: PAS domain S-box protein [Halobacteriales archaeon]